MPKKSKSLTYDPGASRVPDCKNYLGRGKRRNKRRKQLVNDLDTAYKNQRVLLEQALAVLNPPFNQCPERNTKYTPVPTETRSQIRSRLEEIATELADVSGSALPNFRQSRELELRRSVAACEAALIDHAELECFRLHLEVISNHSFKLDVQSLPTKLGRYWEAMDQYSTLTTNQVTRTAAGLGLLLEKFGLTCSAGHSDQAEREALKAFVEDTKSFKPGSSVPLQVKIKYPNNTPPVATGDEPNKGITVNVTTSATSYAQ